ncbi:trans-sulfuration enzyme family protein [Granulosicoccus antarcticus]|uniref:Cystathionine beta-lyase n=1 Tax=Granulosicoccus antarcticus IMCC3135 TaxID=1192854 RepID=A0A2Z2P0N9_9GAMM|nr:aminotransferase class I/II-fold pyridoxal phosphate-dependent enzyme [Granulosicoccus antarcticus]ASJ75698.1 Cystathionine beta-lyase [Granulosicoccus antarcticus IMCC3135]
MTRAIAPATIAAKADHYEDALSGSIVPPIHTSTTYARDTGNQPFNPAHVYARDNNPSFVQAERVLAKLENGEQALLFASGMAAIAAVFYTLQSGAHVVLPNSMYWGVFSWTRQYCARASITVSYYAPDDAASLRKALQDKASTDIVWVETPSNPMMHVTDIRLAAQLAHGAGALLVVDNTVPTPLLTRPLDLGADIVMHSATKSLNGHSDVIAGALVTRENHSHWQRIVTERHDAGAIISPFDASQLLRGMRTLSLRVERACQNAARIAEFLHEHEHVEEVLYPGLESHPGHKVAREQMSGGYGSLMSFLVKGDKAETLAVVSRLQLLVRATSLGGVETLIEHRHSIEPPETGVPENLLRLAVGIEDVDDLIHDLDQALSPSV